VKPSKNPDPNPQNPMNQGTKLSSDIEVTSSSPDDHRLKIGWGYVAAYPHEYLIHFRNGQMNRKTSGQGARCFKMPGDTVFIIPTSLKEIVFEANQLSADNVDIRLRGMAIYRIANPVQIYTQLNFSNRQQAEEKLARMIGDLCRSTAKWLVANMQLEECLRKRKEEIAEALKREVSQVVADPDKGWGVEVITIDIQDVYIQDDEIFSAMQILFKTEKLRASQLSQLEMKKDLQVRGFQQELELAEHRKTKELEQARIEAAIKAEQIRLSQENEKAQFALDQYRVEQNEAISKYKLEQELTRQRQKMQLQTEEEQARAEAKRLAHQIELEAQQRRMEIENSATPLSLEKNFIETALPVIAEAIAKSMNNARMTILQGDGNQGTPFKFIMAEALDILRQRLDTLEVEPKGKEAKK
jgi:regulator of protease activity HflC (stomatin/prohibitin superfamily)